MNEQTTRPTEHRPRCALAPLGRLGDAIDRLFDDFSFALQLPDCRRSS